MAQTTKRKQQAPTQQPVAKKHKANPRKPSHPTIEKELVTFSTLPRELRQQIILDSYEGRLVGFTVDKRSTFLRFNGAKWIRNELGGQNRERAFDWGRRLRRVGGMFSVDAEFIYERLMKAAFAVAKEEFGGEIVMHIRRAGGFELME